MVASRRQAVAEADGTGCLSTHKGVTHKVSLPSVTNPLAWVNPASQSPFAAPANGQGNFTSQLMQALQSGTSSAATAVTGAIAATTAVSATGTTASGSAATPVTLQAMLQSLKSGPTASRGTGGLLNITA